MPTVKLLLSYNNYNVPNRKLQVEINKLTIKRTLEFLQVKKIT